MLQASELRLGNMINTLVGKVLGQRDMVIVDINHIKHIKEGNEYGYTGITLTKEWLIAAGFEKLDNFWHGGSIVSLTINEDFEAVFNELLMVKLSYVHQLQNMYFSLTGKELEIKQKVPQ